MRGVDLYFRRKQNGGISADVAYTEANSRFRMVRVLS